MYNEDNEVTKLWQDYQDGIAYQNSIKLTSNLPKFVDFYEGRQWSAPTKATAALPRPVVNIVKLICRSKKSAILSTPVRIVYKTNRQEVDTATFNHFANYIMRDMQMDLLDKKAIDDGVKKGCYIYHFFWDTEASGGAGAVRCEIIDPLHIFFSNPTDINEQNQKWVLIASRESVDSIKAKADKGVDLDRIVADSSDSSYNMVEQESSKLCTVLTRYFRKNGEVYCEKATKSVIVNSAFALRPDMAAASVELGYEDAPNNDLPDNSTSTNLIPKQGSASLYPIVVGNYELRENCIYGLGEVEGIIPNQKAINFNLAMALLNVQELAWGKYIVLPNALNGQTIRNEPGQVLTDYSMTGNGIRKMTEQPMQSQPMQLIDNIITMTRTATGSTEVMNGEIVGSNMSGAAIAQLQAQAQQPIAELRDMFWLAKEKVGKVLGQFFKLYYSYKEFDYKDETQLDDNGEPSEMVGVFNSSDYANVDFNVAVEAVSGTKASAAGDINLLDSLLAHGAIGIETYLKSYPEDAVSNRTELLKAVTAERASKVNQLAQEHQQQSQQLQQALQVLQEQNSIIAKANSIINQNKQLQEQLISLYNEAITKINQSNEQVKLSNDKIVELTQDNQALARMLRGGGDIDLQEM